MQEIRALLRSNRLIILAVICCIFGDRRASAAYYSQRVPQLEAQLTTASQVKRLTARSDIECAVLCERSPASTTAGGCQSFGFDSGQASCVLGSTTASRAYDRLPDQAEIQWFRETYTYVGVRKFRIIQQRTKGALSFARSWSEYEDGFGDDADFWLGLKAIYNLTASSPRLLRVEAVTWSNLLYVSEYSNFSLRGSLNYYSTMFVSYLTGNSNTTIDALETCQFSTMDKNSCLECPGCSANAGNSGWWFCCTFKANPNGLYYNSAIIDGAKAMYWNGAGPDETALKSIRLMLMV